MATNRAMVEAARRHLLGDDTDIVTVYNAPILAAAIKEMADFAISQSALAVAAERTRIREQIEQLCQQDKLVNTVAKRSVMKIARKLRGATDE